MGMRGMQFAAQLFHENSNRAAHISNRGIQETGHAAFIIAVIPPRDCGRLPNKFEPGRNSFRNEIGGAAAIS